MPSVICNKIEGQITTRRKSDGTVAIDQDWHFRIQADSYDQNRETVLHGTSGVPEYGVIYGPLALQLVGAEGTRMQEHSLLWDCVYHLSNSVDDAENTNQSTGAPQTGDPTLWVPVVELGFEEYEEVFRSSLTIDADERHPDLGGTDPLGYNAIAWTNSAAIPYDTGFSMRKRIITRTFTQYEKAVGSGAVTIDQIESRDDTLNKSVFLGRPKRTVKLNVLKAVLGFYYGVRCWRVDYQLSYKKNDWRIKQHDVSWEYVDPAVHPSGLDAESPPSDIKYIAFKRSQYDSDPRMGALNGKGLPATNQFRPAMRYHKAYESIEFSFIRLT
jgi:hypothetical protein